MSVVTVVVALSAATPAGAAPRPAHPVTRLSTVSTVAATVGTDAYLAAGSDGRGVDVALVDTGVADAPGLGSAVVRRADLTAEAATRAAGLDGFGHGTHLAGIVAGLAPGAGVVSVKVADHRGATDLRTLVAGVDWVIRHRSTGGRNIRVLNLSLGVAATDGDLAPLGAAVERAWRAGIVVVVAAGNGGRAAAGLDRPATEPFVLAVGASDSRGTADRSDDAVASFSSRGDARRVPDLVAPGTSVVSLRAPGSEADRRAPAARVGRSGFRGTGTSQSAAVASAAAALVLSRSPELTPDQVKAVLTGSAIPLPDAGRRAQGGGALDLWRALRTPAPAAAAPDPSSAAAPATTRDAVIWSGNRWSGNRWSGNRWSGNRWSSASWAA
jgi:serine protease AprX